MILYLHIIQRVGDAAHTSPVACHWPGAAPHALETSALINRVRMALRSVKLLRQTCNKFIVHPKQVPSVFVHDAWTPFMDPLPSWMGLVTISQALEGSHGEA